MNIVSLDTIYIEPQVIPPYRATPEQVWDLIHTQLDLRFDFAKQEVLGQEEIWLKPHFYSQDSLLLDAKWMEI